MRIGIRFQETMAGTMTPADGGPDQRLSFTVEARGRRLSHMWTGAPLTLAGVLTLEGSVSRVPVQGTLAIELLSRRLVYELFWRDGADQPHRFYGQKDLTPLHPVESMTVLHGWVVSHGEPVGEATLRFELRDLPSFLGSMRPVPVPAS